jgi:hypothetical protein
VRVDHRSSQNLPVLDDDAMRRAYRALNLDPALEIVADRRPARWITVYVEEAYLSAADEWG